MRAGNRSASISRQSQHGPGTERWSPVPAPGIGYWEPSSAPMRRRQDGGRGGAAGPIPCPSCPCLLPGSCRHFFKSQLVSGWFLFFFFQFCVCVRVCACLFWVAPAPYGRSQATGPLRAAAAAHAPAKATRDPRSKPRLEPTRSSQHRGTLNPPREAGDPTRILTDTTTRVC